MYVLICTPMYAEADRRSLTHQIKLLCVTLCALISLCFSDELQKMNVLVIGPVLPDESVERVQSPLLSTGGSRPHHKAEAAESMFVVPSVPTKEWCAGCVCACACVCVCQLVQKLQE